MRNLTDEEKRVKKKVERDIIRYKEQLKKKARKKGIYENFGQKEVTELIDKVGSPLTYSTEIGVIISKFDDWCMNFNNNIF